MNYSDRRRSNLKIFSKSIRNSNSLLLVVLTLFYLGGGGHQTPPGRWSLVILSGCLKWAQISWLCFYQHLPRPIKAIFQKKILKVSINICHVPSKQFFKKNFWNFEKRKKKIFGRSNIKVPLMFFSKLNFSILHFTCSELLF